MLVVGITIALNALDGFDVLSISLAAAPIRNEFGIGPSITGLLLGMELIGMAIGSIFLGRVADAWGRRPMMLTCLVLMTAGMFMVTTAPGFLALGVKAVTDSLGLLEDWPLALIHISIWRIITGLGIGGMLASINAVVAEYSNAKKKHMNVALMSIGYPVGASVGGFIAADPDFEPFLARLGGLLDLLLPRYENEGKSYLTVAFGCTGGRHRSVYLAERLAGWLRDRDLRVQVAHRELDRAAALQRIARISA